MIMCDQRVAADRLVDSTLRELDTLRVDGMEGSSTLTQSHRYDGL